MRITLAAAVVLALSVGCTDAQPPEIDAGPDAGGGGEDFDFFGEPCVNAPDTAGGEPVLTLCHRDDATGDYTGWCVAGTCRPSCRSTGPLCAAGTAVYDRRFGCYCQPD